MASRGILDHWQRPESEPSQAAAQVTPASNGHRPPRLILPKRHGIYEGGMPSNLFADWQTYGSVVGMPSTNIQVVRHRCRAFERDDGYFRRFLTLLKIMVLGSTGIKLEVKVKNLRRTDTLNKTLNTAITDGWAEWNGLGVCEVTGKLDGLALDAMLLRRCATDGEIFVRLVRGWGENRFGFAVQLLESEMVDWDTQKKNTVNGIEFDKWQRPIGYHLKGGERIPARDMIHVAIWNRPTEVRGSPWASAAVWHLRNLSEYQKAEVIASRIGASKMGFIEQDINSPGYNTAELDPNTGDQMLEMAPGQIEILQIGQKFTPFDPGSPATNFAEFRKAMLRGIASALDVGFNHLANDLTEVNFSSLRFGEATDRENWRCLQGWFINQVKKRIYSAWLEMATLKGQIKAAGFDMSQLANVEAASKWKPRGYQTLDPLKEIQGAKLAVDNCVLTRSDILAEEGKNFEETIDQLAYEAEYAEEAGVELPIGGSIAAPTKTEMASQEEPADGAESV